VQASSLVLICNLQPRAPTVQEINTAMDTMEQFLRGGVHHEEATEETRQREAAAAGVRYHSDLVALAAARTRHAAEDMMNSSRQHQRALMVPLVLSVGTRCRISYLYTPTVRQLVKISYVKAFAPAYTREVYRVTERSLGPGSRRVVNYTLRAEDASLVDGQQSGSRIHSLPVRIPLRVSGVDRRYLQPLRRA
jgi:hypothetical protein